MIEMLAQEGARNCLHFYVHVCTTSPMRVYTYACCIFQFRDKKPHYQLTYCCNSRQNSLGRVVQSLHTSSAYDTYGFPPDSSISIGRIAPQERTSPRDSPVFPSYRSIFTDSRSTGIDSAVHSRRGVHKISSTTYGISAPPYLLSYPVSLEQWPPHPSQELQGASSYIPLESPSTLPAPPASFARAPYAVGGNFADAAPHVCAVVFCPAVCWCAVQVF
jgi:hypothetical protein